MLLELFFFAIFLCLYILAFLHTLVSIFKVITVGAASVDSMSAIAQQYLLIGQYALTHSGIGKDIWQKQGNI
jgi:hypothetical protein